MQTVSKDCEYLVVLKNNKTIIVDRANLNKYKGRCVCMVSLDYFLGEEFYESITNLNAKEVSKIFN